MKAYLRKSKSDTFETDMKLTIVRRQASARQSLYKL